MVGGRKAKAKEKGMAKMEKAMATEAKEAKGMDTLPAALQRRHRRQAKEAGQRREIVITVVSKDTLLETVSNPSASQPKP